MNSTSSAQGIEFCGSFSDMDNSGQSLSNDSNPNFIT